MGIFPSGIQLKKGKKIVLTKGFTLSIAAQILSSKEIMLPIGFTPFCAAIISYFIGISIREINVIAYINKYSWIFMTLSFVLLIAIMPISKVDIVSGTIGNIICYYFSSILGFLFLYSVSIILVRIKETSILTRLLAYISQKSIWIITLHFISFKLVTYIYIRMTGSDTLLLAQFPALVQPGWIWIMYSIAGLVIPLIIQLAYEYIFSRIKKGFKQ